MGAYILRRLALIIPTLIGIMLINFTLVQFVPGGPVEQVLARIEGQGDVFSGIAGGGDEMARSQQTVASAGSANDKYLGARGLPPEFIAQLEKEFGFDKPPAQRFLMMLWNYARFDFGNSYFRSISVVDLVKEKMPVSISLGLWSTLIAYAVFRALRTPWPSRATLRPHVWRSLVVAATALSEDSKGRPMRDRYSAATRNTVT